MRSIIIVIMFLYLEPIMANEVNLNGSFIKPTGIARLGKTNLFNQIYVESGVKWSSNMDTIGSLHMGLIGLRHQLGKKLTLFHSYNYLSQDNFWGNVSQSGYYANFEYKVNGRLKLGFAGSYLNSRARISENFLLGISNKIINNNNFLGLLHATIAIKKLYIKPLIAYSNLNNLSEKQNQFQVGGEVLFDTKNNETLVFGLGLYHFINNGNACTFYKPSVSFAVTEEVYISADYFYTNEVNYSDQNGFVIYNSIDKSYDRTNINLRYEFANNLYLFGVYQFERKQYNLSKTDYHFNSIFLGIKYNL
jgi:hypothetical protein